MIVDRLAFIWTFLLRLFIQPPVKLKCTSRDPVSPTDFLFFSQEPGFPWPATAAANLPVPDKTPV